MSPAVRRRSRVLSFSSLQELILAAADASESIVAVSDWLLLDQGRVSAFADATDDHQWIHLDLARAAQGPFGGTIVHGHLLLSLLPALSSGMLDVAGVAMGINYGLNTVRFLAPVPVGSRVRAVTRLVSAEPTSGGVRLTAKVTMELEGSQKPAMVAESLSLYIPESSA